MKPVRPAASIDDRAGKSPSRGTLSHPVGEAVCDGEAAWATGGGEHVVRQALHAGAGPNQDTGKAFHRPHIAIEYDGVEQEMIDSVHVQQG